jgi:hypothetical protein
MRLGVELGDMTRNFGCAKTLRANMPELDFIIGSLHTMTEPYGSVDLSKFLPKTEEEVREGLQVYLDQLKEIAEWGEFSVLGHLTLPLRYLNEEQGLHVTFDAFEEEVDPEELEVVAYHEAGHLIMLDIIKEGSVGIASISSHDGGFVKRCEAVKRRPYEVLVALAGKAAAELKYGWVASGAQSDIRKAVHLVDDGYCDSATGGLALVDAATFHESPESAYQRETVTAARTEEYLFKAKQIIASNMEYLEKVARALMEKRVLLNSDVKKIRDTVVINRVDIA